MNIFRELIEVNVLKTRLESKLKDAKEAFELSTAGLTDEIAKLKTEEEGLRDQVTLTLKENNESSIVVDNKTITKQTRTTLKIADPNILVSSIIYNADKLAEIGYNADELKEDAFRQETVIIPEYKKQLIDMISKYQDIENELLAGAEKQETEFITIKENAQ